MSTKDSQGAERRTEPRRPAKGPVSVTLRRNGSVITAASGQLMDIADSGFRAQHRTPTLRPGDIVEFERAGAKGLARVVWTRIAGEQVESGFLILAEDAS
jgi:hypothetical protein